MFVELMQVPKTQADCVCKSDAFRKCTVPEVLKMQASAKGISADAATATFNSGLKTCLCTHKSSCDTEKSCPAPALAPVAGTILAGDGASDAPVAGTILAGAVAAAAYMA